MAVTISITESNVFNALRTFMLGILPAGVEIVQGQDNSVPEPQGPDFVEMTMISMPRLSTNEITYTDAGTNPGTRNAMQSIKARIQIDVHGPNSADNSAIISTLFRDEYACDAFAAVNPDIQPLYCEDPKQMPFINGENQYEQRWIIDAAIQYNAVTAVPQDFADTLDVNIVSVDAQYPA
ncbi:phage neck terminator protein [Paraburkholderia saeva]|uniref:phage neck terminator protein n=1 Tax=Paraburkholderia saeva TaxID=2777537 RepID=UPI001D1CD9B3|nr:hypothetical protein [Paraburkholderia saeva]CAG4887976.1 hypothetical protein R52603_00549 [Paraburkholderia saeva]